MLRESESRSLFTRDIQRVPPFKKEHLTSCLRVHRLQPQAQRLQLVVTLLPARATQTMTWVKHPKRQQKQLGGKVGSELPRNDEEEIGVWSKRYGKCVRQRSV